LHSERATPLPPPFFQAQWRPHISVHTQTGGPGGGSRGAAEAPREAETRRVLEVYEYLKAKVSDVLALAKAIGELVAEAAGRKRAQRRRG